MAIERGLCGFENGTLGEFGTNGTSTTLDSIVGSTPRSGTYRLHKTSSSSSFSRNVFPTGTVIGTTGTVTTGSHKRATVRSYFRLVTSGWNANLGGQQSLIGFGGDGGTCSVMVGHQNTAGGVVVQGRQIGLRIGTQSHSNVVGAYPWNGSDLSFDVWYRMILVVDLDVSSNTLLSASVRITDDSDTPAVDFTVTNSLAIGATDALDALGIGPGANSGAFGLAGVFDWDDIVYIGTSNSDASSVPTLPTKTKIIPVLATSFISNQWETGSFSNIDEVPVSSSGGVGDTLSSVLGNGTKVEVELQDSDLLDVGNIIGIKVFTSLAVASSSGNVDVTYNGVTKTINVPSPTFGTGDKLIGYQDWALPQLLTEAQFSASHVDVTKQNSTQQTFLGGVSAEVLWDDLGPPTPAACSPNEGPTSGGTTVTITGSGFSTRTRVLFGEKAAKIVSVLHATLVCTSPRNAAGPCDVLVGDTVLADGFTYIGVVPGRITLGVARRDPEISISNSKGNGASTFNFSLNGEDATDYEAGKSVRIDMGDGGILSRGVLLTTELTCEDSRFNDRVDVSGSDDTWILNSKLVVGTFTTVAADTIIKDIMTKYGPDFSTTGVQTGLPIISVAFFRDVTVGGALDKICGMISAHWYLEAGDTVDTIHVYTGASESGAEEPDDIDDENDDLVLNPAIKIKRDISQMRNRVYVRGKGISNSTTSRPPVGLPQGDPGGADPAVDPDKALLETGGSIDSDRNSAPYNWFACYGFVWTTAAGDSLGDVTARFPSPYPLLNPYFSTASNHLRCNQNTDDRVTGLKIYRQIQQDGPHGGNAAAYGNTDMVELFGEGGRGPFFLITTIGRGSWPVGLGPILFLDTASEDALVGGEMKKFSELVGQDNTANIFAMVEDLPSQAALKALLGVGDGVREYMVTDASITTQAAATARGNAELALFKDLIVTVTYATRDAKSKVGRTVHIDLTDPEVSGDFKIQSVQLQEIHVNDELIPLYVVTASSMRFDLEDLLHRVVLSDNNEAGGSGSLSNQAGDGTEGGGHAAYADTLYTPRNINAVAFNGSTDITVSAAMDHLNAVPSGTVNGSNTVFTTAATYVAGTLCVYLNGLRQKKTTDYSETTTTTFTFTTAPVTGDLIVVDYQHAS